jgi:PAS domain S-box-containing protein
MSLSGNIIANLSVLYVEDSKVTRETISIMLKKKFKKVFVAKDGEEGLLLGKKHKSDIDIIITDVNMPKLSGIEMINLLRKEEFSVPVIFTSAYTDSDLLLGAMELGITDYLVKPFSIPNLFIRIEHIFEEIHYQHLVLRQEQELNQYLELLNKVAIVSKTDIKGKILFVNEIFCEVSGYNKEELIGKPHNIVRHPDMPKELYEELWKTILSGNIWKGKIKNLTKNSEAYYVNATILPIFDDNEEIIGFIGIRFLITEDEDDKREFRKKVVGHLKLSKENEIKLSNELEILKNNSEKSKNKLAKQLADFATEIRKLQINKRTLEDEIQKLQEQVEEQNKIIVNLKEINNLESSQK